MGIYGPVVVVHGHKLIHFSKTGHFQSESFLVRDKSKDPKHILYEVYLLSRR